MDGRMDRTRKSPTYVSLGTREDSNVPTEGGVHHIKRIWPAPGQGERDDWASPTHPVPASSQFCLFPPITEEHPGDLVGPNAQDERQKGPKAFLLLTHSHSFHLRGVAWATAACRGHAQAVQGGWTCELRVEGRPCGEKGRRDTQDRQREWPPWHQHTVPPPRPAAWIPIRPIFPGYSASPQVAPPSERPTCVPKDRHIRGSLRQLGARAKHQN